MKNTSTINLTIEVENELVVKLENYLKNNFNLINYQVVPDTKILYENNPYFRKLVKIEKEARLAKYKYINDNI